MQRSQILEPCSAYATTRQSLPRKLVLDFRSGALFKDSPVPPTKLALGLGVVFFPPPLMVT